MIATFSTILNLLNKATNGNFVRKGGEKGFAGRAGCISKPDIKIGKSIKRRSLMSELLGKIKGLYFIGKAMEALKSEKGQTLVEYALILVLIAIVVILMLSNIGQSVNNSFSTVNSALQP